MIENLQVVLFDIDDTLFDRQLAQKQSLELIVKQFPAVFSGLPREPIIAAWEESDRLAVIDFAAGGPADFSRGTRNRQFLRLLGLPEGPAEAITEFYVREYPRLNVPVPGALSLVKTLRRNYRVGVISNSLPDVQYTKLDTLGLRDLLSCIVLSEEFGIRKPDPRIFYYTAELLSVSPECCLYVGDSYTSDIVGAKSSRMKACWLKRGESSSMDISVKADYIISELSDLLRIIPQID